MRVKVGDPSISWHGLQADTDEKKILVVEGGSERIAGITTEEIALIEIGGNAVLRRTQAMRSSEFGNRTTISVVFQSDFQPLSHHDETDEYRISIRYDGPRVVGTKSKAGSDDISIERHISSAVFDYHSLELILRLLPLNKAYSVQVPVYHVVHDREIEVGIQVSGREIIRTGDGIDIDAWVVETNWGYIRQCYWIYLQDKRLLKQSSNPREGFEIRYFN